MKAVIVKSIALVALLVFATVLVSEHAEPQANLCQNALLICNVARIVAAMVCASEPRDTCDLANAIADAFCDWAAGICGGN